MKKGVIAIIICLILIIILCLVEIFFLNNKIVEISKKYDSINSKVQKNSFNNTSSQDNSGKEDEVTEPKMTEVEFIRTFIVLADLHSVDATGQYNFYAIDQFQNFDPFVVKIDKNYTLKADKYYEFTFKGAKIDGKDYSIKDIFDNFTIVDIKETNKIGLDQIQDAV